MVKQGYVEVNNDGDTESYANVRPEIVEFAIEMEMVMEEHDSKKGDSWKEPSKTDIDFLYSKLAEEFAEVIAAEHGYGEKGVTKELLDLANITMMLFHRISESKRMHGAPRS